jgi:biopolymer transport protein ExbD
MLLSPEIRADGPSIEITPMIDMVFLLLIFFLVATTFQQSEREMQIALPAAASSVPISAAFRELIVNVEADGGIIVAGQRIDASELQRTVTELVEANPEQKVSVRGDHRTAYQDIVRVLDICKSSGIQQPYLDTLLAE